MNVRRRWLAAACALALLAGVAPAAAHPALNPAPPTEPVKLIFIHHSTGGNWLADPNGDQPYGGLGRALMENHYYVSATNYGWGPEGIGDRTDIPNWPEWFLGPNRDEILRAVYTENGQNVGDFGAWSRLADDPGGENTIIMFKSCFPNSNLDGNPNDPPLDEYNDWEYSVANAKAVYIALLDYFRMRPDKLFIVITAPPLLESDTTPEQAANARAFDDWLVYDWLRDYPYANVAVFDYFNVLTDPDNHHRWNGSELEHLQATDNNFSAYPSGDNHPSTAGHSKATAEFVPLLNVAYNRWRASGPVAPQPTAAPTEPGGATPPPLTGEARGLDNFEADLWWSADGGEGGTFECGLTDAAHDGAAALQLTYAIPAGSWAGCGRYYDAPQDWSGTDGLSFWWRTDVPDGLWVTFMVFSGNPEDPTPFEFGFPTSDAWEQVVSPWADFTRAEWASEDGLAVLDLSRITGMAFSVGDASGDLWLDDVALFTGDAATPPPVVTPAPDETVIAPLPTAAPPGEGGGGLPCASAPLGLSLVMLSMLLSGRKSKSKC